MSIDSAFRSMVANVVHETGTSVSLRRITVGAYDPVTGTAPITPSDVTVTGHLTEYKDRELNETIKAGDRKLMLAASDLSWIPEPKDRAVIGSTVYDIVRVQQHLAAQSPALVVVQLRG